MSDPWAAFADAPALATPAAPATDPWAHFADAPTPGVRFAPEAPADVRNVPTAKDDPIYHGAVPVGQAPDMGATTAFVSGVQGAPLVGPAISSGIQAAAAGARSLAGGGSYADERRNVQEMTDLARQQHPTAATAGDVTGAVAATAPVIAGAPEVFGAGGGALTAGQVGAGAASGAALGGADAAVRHGLDPTAITQGAGFGALGGAAGPVVGAAIGGVGRALTGSGKVAAPTIEELKNAASADYSAARGLGVHYTGETVGDMARSVGGGLEQDGILPVLAPKTHAILSQLGNPPAGSTIDFGGLEAARRAFGHAAKDFANPTEQLAASRAIDGIDDFLSTNGVGALAKGSTEDGAKIAQIASDARANYAAAKRAENLTGVSDNAELRAAAANSGENVGNQIRRRAAVILGNDKLRAGFDQGELLALRAVAEGSLSQNVLRKVGNYLGGGGGLGALSATYAGAAAGGPLGAMAGPLVGLAAKRMSNASTKSALQQVIEQTSRRSPLFDQMQITSPPIGGPGVTPLLSQILALSAPTAIQNAQSR